MSSEVMMIPKSRVGAVIGKNGETRELIEHETKSKIKIDSESGEVRVMNQDAGAAHATEQVIKAIGRGFNPEIALKLMNQDYYLEILELREIVGKNSNVQKSKKGRVIGRDGVMRKKIEELTGCFVSVFGKTIALIGKQEDLFKAVNTVELLLKGSEHKTAMKYLVDEPGEEFNL